MERKTSRVVQTRLDDETSAVLKDLTTALQWTESQTIRHSLKLLASCTPKLRMRRIVGIGKFSSGLHNLGSNKKHLNGFGK